MRQADAAVRGGTAGGHARMQGDPRHGQALHERHRGAAIDVGVVLHLLVEDGEHPGWGREAADAGRNDGGFDEPALVVDPQARAAERDDELHLETGARTGDGLENEFEPVLQRAHGCIDHRAAVQQMIWQALVFHPGAMNEGTPVDCSEPGMTS